MKGLLGRKLGMTQVFTEDGVLIPVTVVEVTPNVVLQKKTVETDGYNAVQLGFEEIKEKLGVENEEQIEIADYELPFDAHSDMPLWEINANCRMVLEMEGTPVGNEMKAIQQKWFSSFDEFIDHKDEIRYYDVGDGAALAEYLICEENVFGEIPHELQKHIDYHSYGNELEMDDRYLFTTSGVFRYQ